MLFRIYRCLVAHRKCIFWKCISVILCWECKLISVSILPSNTIFRKTERERELSERERGRRAARREREKERSRAVAPSISPLRRRSQCRLRAVDRDLAKHRADREALHRADREAPHRLRASLSSFFSQFDRI